LYSFGKKGGEPPILRKSRPALKSPRPPACAAVAQAMAKKLYAIKDLKLHTRHAYSSHGGA
jgi:hypothetical protein